MSTCAVARAGLDGFSTLRPALALDTPSTTAYEAGQVSAVAEASGYESGKLVSRVRCLVENSNPSSNLERSVVADRKTRFMSCESAWALPKLGRAVGSNARRVVRTTPEHGNGKRNEGGQRQACEPALDAVDLSRFVGVRVADHGVATVSQA